MYIVSLCCSLRRSSCRSTPVCVFVFVCALFERLYVYCEFVLQPEEEFLQKHTGECVRAFVGVMHACVYRGFVLEIVKDKSVGVLRAQHDAHMTT